MAEIISNVDSDVQKLRKLKNEIEEVKKALMGINVEVDMDIAKNMEARLKSLTVQYNELVDNIAKAEGEIMLSAKRINDASGKIISTQEEMAKTAAILTSGGSTNSKGANTEEMASIQAQAKAYEDLETEINGILGTREANVKRMIDEMNAIRLINAEINKITHAQGESASLSSAQQKRLEQLNNSLSNHKTALAEVQQNLTNNVRLDTAAATSRNELSQSLSRMRMTYRELTEEERNSPFGKELLTSINQADTKIKELNATISTHQRSIEDYTKQWNSFQSQMQMVARELPNLAINPQSGIVSLTNNIPYLVDEFKKAKDAHKAYIDQVKAGDKNVKAAPSFGKQILSSLLSWQTGLVMGITLITAYRKEIGEWVGSLFTAKKTLSETYQSTEDFQKRVGDVSGSEIATLEQLSEGWKRLGNDIDAQKKYILDNKEVMNSLGVSVNDAAEAERLFNSNKETFILGILQRAKATAAMELAAEEYKKAVQKMMEADAMPDKSTQFIQTSSFGTGYYIETDNLKKRDAQKEAEDLFRSGSELVKKFIQFSEEKTKIVESIGIETTETIIDGSVEAIESAIALKQQSLKKVTDRKEYKRIEAEIKAEQAKLKAITGDGNGQDQPENLRKEQEKYELLVSKQKSERIRANEDLEMQVEEAHIKSMEEGSEKTISQIELNFEKEKQAIERQKKDVLRKKIEDARSMWEADPENKGKPFDAGGIKLSDEEQKHFDNLYKYASADNQKAYSELAKQYLSYTDQRLEIEKKFNNDLAVLQEARKKARKKGDTDEVAKYDRAIVKATAEKGKELIKYDFGVMKQSPEYIRAFEDLNNTSSETLGSLLEQLENAKNTAASVLNPEDLREYTASIQAIMDELDSRNPFQALADRQKELAEAEQELADAKKQLDAVNRGAKIVTGVKSILQSKEGKMKIENTYLSAEEALSKYNEAKDKARKANANFIEAEQTAREKVDKLAEAIKGVGGAIGGEAGEIISLMGDIALFATGTIEGISRVAQTGASAIAAVEKASVILSIISAALQLLHKISGLGTNQAFKQYEAYAEKVKEITALTDAVNEYRIAALEARQAEENWFSEDNLKNLRDYKKLHDEVAKAYGSKATETQATYQNEKGGGWLTGAFNGIMNWLSPLGWTGLWQGLTGQNYKKGTTAAMDNLRVETRKKSKGFLGTGIGAHSQKTEDLATWMKRNELGDLWSEEYVLDESGKKINLINSDAAQVVLDNYGDKLVGQTKETLEALIELREQYDEYKEQLHEYVSSLYEPLVNNFVDSLWDWFDNGKDALDSFKGYASDTFRDIVSDMMRTIVLDKVVGTFSEDIAALYEEYADGSIDETELMKKVAERTEGLVDNYESNIPTLQSLLNQVNGYLKDAGIDLKQPESSSQTSSKSAFQTMSQDTGNELNSRFTALQMTGEEIKNQTFEQTGLLSSIDQRLSLLDLTNENLPFLTTPETSLAEQAQESIASGYQSQISVVFPTEDIKSLADKMSSLENIVDEMRTVQTSGWGNIGQISGNVERIIKNSPETISALKEIQNRIKNL